MPAHRPGNEADLVAALGSMPSGSPVSDVAGRMLDLFMSGQVAPGTRLPPERQLATTLGVGRSAVREALAALEILGIVDVRPGSGSYLRGTASELLPQTLSWGMLIGERNTAELVELRSGLEIYTARLAASRAEEADLDALARDLDRMRVGTRSLSAFARADLEFHRALAAATGNTMLVDLLGVARSLLKVYADRAVRDEAGVQRAIDEHAAILDAITRHDEDAAASAMAVHMATVSERLAITAG